jgi:membrane protein YqaA with SNARE-associated domain
VTGLFRSIFHVFLSWWGAFVLGALDSSLLFFLPFGNDMLVVYLSARHRSLFWFYPALTAAGSLLGAAGTYWIGHKAGEAGLHRLASQRRVDRVKKRVKNAGAVAMAVPAVLPPPFPLTPFILTCGALEVSPMKFFAVFGTARLIRFGGEAYLARHYGEGVLRVLRSDTFRLVVIVFVALAVVGTIASGVILWRRTRRA